MEIISAREVNAFLSGVNTTWNPLPENAIAAVLRDEKGQIIAIAAAYQLYVAGGSWVRPDLRGQGISKLTRKALEDELRSRGASVYVSFPGTEEERKIFAAYGGSVAVRPAQVKGL